MNGSSEREAISRRYADNETDLEAKTLRCIEAKSVTEINFVNSGNKHESIVGWAFQPNNEKSIQSYPSPEFLNSLSFIKKFYPVLNLLHAPRVPQKQRGCNLLHLLAIRTRCTPSVRKFALPFGAREKFPKVTHDNSCNSRHSERQRKNPAYCNKNKSNGEINMNNSTETDHASMPLGVFASELIPDVGMAMPTYFDFASKSVSLLGWKAQPTSNIGGVGTPPYVANSTQLQGKKNSLTETNLFIHSPIHLFSLKRAAFTLAEVLITLGIIGVVAALTIPNVVSNYKKKVVETRLAKLYSVLNQAVELSEEKNGACTTWEWGDINNHRDSAYMEKWWKTYMADYIPNVQTVTKNSVATSSISGNGSYLVYFKDGTALKIEAIPGSYIWVVIYVKPQINIKNFNKGDVYQHDSMVSGRDYFAMFIEPSSKCSFDVNYYDNLSRNKLIESCKAPKNLGGACLKMIKDNGWKIPDDYPIKF